MRGCKCYPQLTQPGIPERSHSLCKQSQVNEDDLFMTSIKIKITIQDTCTHSYPFPNIRTNCPTNGAKKSEINCTARQRAADWDTINLPPNRSRLSSTCQPWIVVAAHVSRCIFTSHAGRARKEAETGKKNNVPLMFGTTTKHQTRVTIFL